MKTIDVLIVVDVEGALAGTLSENVYLIDTNKYFGSGSEGQEELRTACLDGQVIQWRIQPVAVSNDVEITGFTGQIISENICNPEKVTALGETYWTSRVETQGKSKTYQYSVNVTADGKAMTFDPFLVVKAD
ncbi:MAG TPA: hypothetical protein DCE42_25455 [Myxococcales bacterium]|nr:hypothetical protein [Deltaproteobacteria bacterium]HAA58135.1 hypothetical protein [Myxococcales bacterium]|tara:strand:+ start:1089 stop:1484 length:396 start_codon:yes stop_codon:yes gene_type:complete